MVVGHYQKNHITLIMKVLKHSVTNFKSHLFFKIYLINKHKNSISYKTDAIIYIVMSLINSTQINSNNFHTLHNPIF